MTLLGKLHDISIIYGEDFVLENVKGDIPSNVVIGIVGGNGQGKSSLLSILSNEGNPSSGKTVYVVSNHTLSISREICQYALFYLLFTAIII